MREGKQLLIIHYYFPPVHMVSSVRIFHFYQESLRHFEGVSVLSSTNRHLFRQDETLETGCQDVTDVPAYDLRRFTLSRREGNAPHLSSAQKARPWVQLLQRLLNSFPLNLIVGDGGAYYIWKGYRAGKRLVEARGITHLFSSYRPYSDHLIAYLLKRRYPQLFWIADFRDLQVDPVLRNVVCPRFQQACNRYLLSRADVLSTVSQGLKAQLEQVHPRVVVLRNGIGEGEMTPLPVFERFTIVYTGSIYPEQQTAAPLFEAIAHLLQSGQWTEADVQFVYAGKDAGVWRQWAADYGLSQISVVKGWLPVQPARALQYRAQINLLLSWSKPGSQGILTGKLYEYLAARRPVLCVLNGAVDQELELIIQSLGHSMVVEVGEPLHDLKRFLLNAYQAWQRGEAPPLVAEAALSPYRWRSQMEAFMSEIAGQV